MPTEKIIKQVADGERKYTISDNNIASINAAFYPILDVNTRMSLSQRIAWMVHLDNIQLRDSINLWLDEMQDKTEYYYIYNKYFKHKRSYRARVESEFYSLNNERISQYDDIIQRYAENIGWDWRLLASVIYQESQFNPVSESWADALGLMQLMPETAERLNVMDRANPEESVRGGTKYLGMLMEKLNYIPDSIERVKMALASYNCGFGHVLDARRLAEANGDDPNVWTDNVEKAMLELSYPENYNAEGIRYGYVRGIEPVTYVEQIFERYAHYCRFIGSDSTGVE
jgi:membrane-bound lytic murein transglycosylase F